MPHYFYENKWGVLGAGGVLYALMFIYMRVDTNIYEDAAFFNVEIGGEDASLNPQVLGVPIETSGQFWVFCFFFFFNAFFGVWLRVLIVDRYNLLINDGDEGVKKSVVKQYPPPLFWSYNVWTSARNFFNILGILSNIWFFGFTVLGAFIGNVLSRRWLIGLDDLDHEKETLLKSSSLFKPMRSLSFKR